MIEHGNSLAQFECAEGSMVTQEWLPVGGVSPEALGQARLQAHNAAQWPARLAHSYAAHEPGDAHLDLIWDAREAALVGRDIGGGIAVGLDVADLALQFRESGRRSPHRLAMEGRSPAEVEAWFLVELLHRGCDRENFSKILPFEIAGLMSGDNVDFAQEAHSEALAELARWQANATGILRQATNDAGPVICSPRHFDTAVLLPADGHPAATVRAGFAPGDDRDPEPFFYVAIGATLAPAGPASLPRVGPRQLRNLVQKSLPAAEVVASAAAPELVLKFLRSGIAECQRQLTH
jgi:hypothetical protein